MGASVHAMPLWVASTDAGLALYSSPVFDASAKQTMTTLKVALSKLSDLELAGQLQVMCWITRVLAVAFLRNTNAVVQHRPSFPR